jgi:hypothetical protein
MSIGESPRGPLLSLWLLILSSFSSHPQTHSTTPSPPRDFPAAWEYYDVGDDDDEDDE